MMYRWVTNTVSVLFATLLATVGVYAVVSSLDLDDAALGSVAQADGSLVCPATGCSAVSCHATAGGSVATAAGDSELQVCPATGCTSYGCHATDGTSVHVPRGGGGRGLGGGRGSQTTEGLGT